MTSPLATGMSLRRFYRPTGRGRARYGRRACAGAGIRPALVGIVRDWSDGYSAALFGCAALQALAGTWVLFGARRSAREQA